MLEPFPVSDLVFVKNFSAGKRWFSGTIVKTAGPVSFRQTCQYHQTMDEDTPEMSSGSATTAVPPESPESPQSSEQYIVQDIRKGNEISDNIATQE